MVSLEAFLVMGLLLMFITFPMTLFNLIEFYMALGFLKDDVQKSREKEEKILSGYKF